MSSNIPGATPVVVVEAPAVKPWYKSLTLWANLALLVLAFVLDGLVTGELRLPGIELDTALLAKIVAGLNLILRVGFTKTALGGLPWLRRKR